MLGGLFAVPGITAAVIYKFKEDTRLKHVYFMGYASMVSSFNAGLYLK
jgi:hypothetical protein